MLFNILHGRSSFIKDFPRISEEFSHLATTHVLEHKGRQPPHNATQTPSSLWPPSYPRILLYEFTCSLCPVLGTRVRAKIHLTHIMSSLALYCLHAPPPEGTDQKSVLLNAQIYSELRLSNYKCMN